MCVKLVVFPSNDVPRATRTISRLAGAYLNATQIGLTTLYRKNALCMCDIRLDYKRKIFDFSKGMAFILYMTTSQTVI